MSDKPLYEALRELIDALASDTNLLTEEVFDALTTARASLEDEPGSHAWACLHCWTMGTAGEECAKTDACHMHPLHWSSRASLEDDPGLRAVIAAKDEQITTLKKALDAVLESEEISDEAADDLEGENVKLRGRVAELEEAVREALNETEAAGDPWVRLSLIEEILTRAMKGAE